MAELNFGYNDYNREESGGYYNTTFNQWLQYYGFTKTRVLSAQVEARYAFYSSAALKWKHYLGISIGLHQYFTKSSSFSDYEDPGSYGYRIIHSKSHAVFTGLQYFGAIALGHKLSLQYLAAYSFSAPFMGQEDIITNTPGTKRIHVNFGLGYCFKGR